MILSAETKIWIYGCGTRGRLIEKRLKQEGIHICGFIDRSPERCAPAAEGADILKPDEISPAPDAVVVCSVANVFTHDEIAEALAKQGFLYIIYKCFGESPAQKKINALYDSLTSFLEGGCVCGREIPAYADCKNPDAGVNMDSCGTVCANIPAELLFGLTRDCLENSLLIKDTYLLNAIPEKNLLYYTSPQKMMQYFAGGVDEPAWERCKELWFACRNFQSFSSPLEKYSDGDQNRGLEDRYAIFQKMDQLFCENPTFFKDNPISVVWNEKGGFNIQDGNNRAAFLLAKGLHYLPAEMSAAGYAAWTGVDGEIKEVERALEKMELPLRSPILHPRLKNVPCALEYYSHKKVAALCDWLWRRQIDPDGLSVCEYYCENDLCGSHLARMGGNLSVVDTEAHLALHRALDKLYQLNTVCYHRQEQNCFQVILSNQAEAWAKLAADKLQAEWYIFEFVDAKDADIAAKTACISPGRPEYLVRCLVGSRVYKVVAVKGGRTQCSLEGKPCRPTS